MVAAAAVIAMTLGGCSATSDAAGSDDAPSILNLGITEEPTSFAPALSGPGTLPYYQSVYDSLLLREPDGELSPMLATEWVYNDTQTELTLTLRDDVAFADGSALDSSDVKANLDAFAAAGGPESTQLKTLASVDAPDATTVVLTLSEPEPALLIYLSNSAGFIANEESLTGTALTTTPDGSGPYTLDATATTVGSQYTFVRNADYWGTELPYDTIVLKPLSDVSARLNALKSGQINGALLSNVSSGQEAAAAGFTQVPSEVNFHGLLFFDREGTAVPALGDVRVRQAINYAIDRDLLVESVLFGEGTATSQIFGTGAAGYDEELDSYYDFDPEKARELLADAGFADGFDLTMPTVTIFDSTMLTLMAQMLADVGITVTYEDVPIADLFTALRGGTYPSTYMQFAQPQDWVLINQFIAADATWNPFNTADPAVQELIDTYKNGDAEAQAAAAEELNAIIVEEAWFAPFYRVVQQLFVDENTTAVPQVEVAQPSIYNWAPKN